jgi:predicted DNA-binding protein (MmcQ/YjbR family)
MTISSPSLKKILAVALSYPEAHEDHPWGETVVKVKGKVFIFLGKDKDGSVGCSVKLPTSQGMALSLPFCSPTGYGLGKSGWVSAKFTNEKSIPVPLILEWLKESYLAVAPKTLSKRFLESATLESPAKSLKKKPSPTKRASTKVR